MVWIVQQCNPVDAQALAADLIRFADYAVATAVADIALEVAGGSLASGATDKLICRAPADPFDTHPCAGTTWCQLGALLAGDRARSIADHPFSVECVSTWTGANAIDACRPHFGTTVEVGPARLTRAAADQRGDLDTDAIPAAEPAAARCLWSAWESIARTGQGVRCANARIVDHPARAVAVPVEAGVTGTTGICKLAWGAGCKTRQS